MKHRKKRGTPLQLRQRLGFTQQDFWARVGITQSAGSRYENGGRPLPAPVQMLIELAYGNNPRQTLKRLRGAS